MESLVRRFSLAPLRQSQVTSFMQVAKQEAQVTQAAVRLQKARLTATDRGALLGEIALPAGQISVTAQLAGRPDVSGIAGRS